MTFLSLKRTLIYSARQALFSKHEGRAFHFTNFSYSSLEPLLDGFEVPIRKISRTRNILYTSAIAQLLLRERNVGKCSTVSDVSKQIVDQLENSKSKTLNNKRNPKSCESDHKVIDDFIVSKLWGEFEIRTQEPGWIAFCLSETGLNTWLTHLNSELNYFINHYLEAPTGHSVRPILAELSHDDSISSGSISNDSLHADPRRDPRVWQAQYIHGRCCCLLRLWNAQVDKCYQVNDRYQAKTPTLTRQDSLGAIAERETYEHSASAQNQVIHTLVALLDLAESDLFWIPYRYPSKQYFLLLKAVCQLCQSFEQFLAIDLSGFGKVDNQTSVSIQSAFQARFALISVVQKTLKVLLVRCLGLSVPTHL